MSVLVLLRIWILHSRNRKITIALMAMLILYFSTCIAALAYMLSEIRYERRCAAKIVWYAQPLLVSLDPASPEKCGTELILYTWCSFLSEWLATLCTNTPAETISISQWLIWNVEYVLRTMRTGACNLTCCRCIFETCLFGLMVYTLRQQKSTAEFSRTSHFVRSLSTNMPLYSFWGVECSISLPCVPTAIHF